MPNTLAHIGIQGLASQAIFRNADLKWVFIGCIIPDIPWILRHILLKLPFLHLNPYYLKLFVMVQASLVFCLIFCLILASFSKNFLKTFAILFLNSFLHLLLDACQIKWANGVHLMAPLSWELTHFSFFWPESPITFILTGFGLIFILLKWQQSIKSPINLTLRPSARIYLCAGLFIVYMISPFYMMNGPLNEDNHFINTFKNYDSRPGKYVEFDREKFIHQDSENYIKTYTGEKINVSGIKGEHSMIVSARAHFVKKNKVNVLEHHEHLPMFRDYASYLGLFLILLVFILSFVRERKMK